MVITLIMSNSSFDTKMCKVFCTYSANQSTNQDFVCLELVTLSDATHPKGQLYLTKPLHLFDLVERFVSDVTLMSLLSRSADFIIAAALPVSMRSSWQGF